MQPVRILHRFLVYTLLQHAPDTVSNPLDLGQDCWLATCQDHGTVARLCQEHCAHAETKRSAGKNVSEMIYFVSGGTQKLNSINQWRYIVLPKDKCCRSLAALPASAAQVANYFTFTFAQVQRK